MNTDRTVDLTERIESACYLGCHLCARAGQDVEAQRVKPMVVHRGLIIVCVVHGEIGMLTPAGLAERMAEAAERDTKQRIMGRQTVGLG